MEGWFRFKGKDSRDFGIAIAKAGERIRAQKRLNEVEIPGRHGFLTLDEGTFQGYTLAIECGIRARAQIDAICAWLTGSGDLQLSTEPERVYRATVSSQISISDMAYLYQAFQVQFRLQPFGYSQNPFGDRLTLTAPGRIYGRGTYPAAPSITVYGSGDITLIVNGREYGLLAVDGFLTIDSGMMEVYKNGVSRGGYYRPPADQPFPLLAVGENAIGWQGKVERVEIDPEWRWL